ncbi:MAG: citramalate synthase [Actinomycetota bacterium]|nr:citramalate synthase [Actinomycetota bacterium]
MELEIYDTTLRDGSQQEGISLTVSDKLRVAALLDDLGVAYVEGGWPGANKKDTEFFARARNELSFRNSKLAAFGSTRRPRGDVRTDTQLQALLDAETEVITLVGKAWDYHVREALGIDLDEGVRMVGESIEYLRSQGRRVFFDAEHFFDGFGSNPEFALAVLRAAREAGAERLVLCDTNGGSLPTMTLKTIAQVQAALPDGGVGVHYHNDIGTAVASSLAAVEAGVTQVQGCINGYGERTGNANLSTLIPDLQLKMDRKPIAGELSMLTSISHHIAEIVNIALDPHLPYVGTSAFTHKAGLHTSALAKRSDAYEHEEPEQVGNRTRMVVSELAGRASVLAKADELALEMDDGLALAVVEKVKDLEHQGYHFEAADGSFELLVRSMAGWTNPYFDLESFRVQSDRRADEDVVSEATVKLTVDGERRVFVGEGVGPVHALDQAIRGTLQDHYPEIENLRLTDYRVRVLDSQDGTSARVRVLIETSDHETAWGTIGVHENVIEASWQALTEGIVVGLMRQADQARSGLWDRDQM